MKPGIYEIAEADYHADLIDNERPSVSSSILNTIIRQSPLHAWHQHPRLNPDHTADESGTFDVGTAAHSVLLEGDLTNIVEIPYADYKKKEAQELRDAAHAEGKTPLKSHELVAVLEMVESARTQLATFNLEPAPFTDGKPEQTVVWDGGGVLCRARPDWLTFDGLTVWDYKTAHDAFPERWSKRALFNNGYDVQAAFYLRGIRAVLGTDARWRWVVQEKRPPYALTVVEPGADVLATAGVKVDWALRRWRECMASGVWPAFGADVFRADVPSWAEDARWLDELEEAA